MRPSIWAAWAALISLGLTAGCSTWGGGVYGWPNNTRPHTDWAALGGLDGDGDLAASLANGEKEGVAADTVWLNDGAGGFEELRPWTRASRTKD